ncbi:uncharacterized protein LOC112464092 [Temnothorax curvispinosus]|uniref:Uncharacterized protein LOC112464092 n=1 Tax=Temnothorax curvispinosus TaxID=300111 RepID=A0A6J1QXR5_9HYME|nr:uncharacterized protein LOC112464092 [Temnothorax curvispinosus]
MLVLNDSEHATDKNIFTTATIDDIIKSTFGSVKTETKTETRKKLNASNVKFLQSLGFAQDLYTLPCESFLYVEGTLTVTGAAGQADNVVLGNNCVAFMFDEIRYELDGVEIDHCRNVGITSTLKNYVTVSSNRSVILQNAGWEPHNNPNGYFNFCVPLNLLLGFCEDYKRVWRMPHVVLSEVNKLSMLRALGNGRYLSMGFRSWDLYEYPLLQNTTKHSWAIKTATQLEKPRYVVFALQTGRKNVMSADTSRFDDCKLTNVKLYLNSEVYPYDDLNLNFGKHRWTILYDMYARFCKGYYGYEYLEPSLTVSTFLRNGPFVIIDCSRQNKFVKNATVDVRLEFDCMENVPPNTSAYCLIIHDRVIEYNPLTNVVRKIV